MAVPAHDERDFEFAVKFGLPVRRVVAAPGTEDAPMESAYIAHSDDEVLVNGGEYTGLRASEAAAGSWPTSSRALGRAAVTYRLRDWLISRQRYWARRSR